MNGDLNYSTRSTHVIASKTAYLIGIFEQYFWPEEMESRIFLKEIYEDLNKQKSARIVRNLCMVRTSILMNFKKINELMRYENMLLENMSEEYIPQGCFNRLRDAGIPVLWRPFHEAAGDCGMTALCCPMEGRW